MLTGAVEVEPYEDVLPGNLSAAGRAEPAGVVTPIPRIASGGWQAQIRSAAETSLAAPFSGRRGSDLRLRQSRARSWPLDHFVGCASPGPGNELTDGNPHATPELHRLTRYKLGCCAPR